METKKSPEKKPAASNNVKSPEPAKKTEKERGPLKEICIEVCQNCQTHKWCTRHDDKKYNGLFEEVKTAIQGAIGGEIQVVKNLNVKKPRIGAFEVSCNDIVIFSKIKCGLFPVPSALAQRIQSFVKDYQSGKPVDNYSSIEEKKYSPPKKKITQTTLDWNAKYEELKKSQMKQKEKQNAQNPAQETEKPAENEKENEHHKETENEKSKENHSTEEPAHKEHEEIHEEKKEIHKQPSKVHETKEEGIKEGGAPHE